MWTIEHARSSDSDLCASSWSPDDDDKHGNKTMERETTIEISCGCYQSADYGKRLVSEFNRCRQINTTA